jgi:hypothetical protein
MEQAFGEAGARFIEMDNLGALACGSGNNRPRILVRTSKHQTLTSKHQLLMS